MDGAGSSAAVRGGLSETVTPVVRKNIVDRDVFDVDWICCFGGCVRSLGRRFVYRLKFATFCITATLRGLSE